MKQVIVTYDDGTTAEFRTVGEAASTLGCTATSVRRLARGIASQITDRLGIRSVELGMPKGRNKGVRKKGVHRVLCTCEETGKTLVADSMKDAMKLTGFPFSQAYFSEVVDKGVSCHGWKYDTLPTEKAYEHLEFKDDVPKETLDLLRYMALSSLHKYFFLTDSMKEDAVAYAVVHAASDLSCGKWDSSKFPTFNVWLWMRARDWVRTYMRRELKWHDAKVDVDDRESSMTKESWMETLCPVEDEDWSFMDEIPEHLRPLAECLIHGLDRQEVCKALGIPESRRLVLMRELRKWAEERKDEGTAKNE